MISPETWSDAAMQRALAQRDISTVYRLLTRVGVSQRWIAELIGQSQLDLTGSGSPRPSAERLTR